MITKNRSVLATMLSCCVGLTLACANVFAQDFVLEEILVTATKRQQALQDTPVAVSVINADTIEKAQILDIIDLQATVPSLRVTQLQTSGNTNFLIRGFGNGANNPGIEPSVGVFIDGVYRSRSAAAISDLPNIQQIEVLRGPQSTLFGKNASAGVISVMTALPGKDFGGSAKVTFGNYGQTIIKGEISGPVSDNLSFGLSASSNESDGYFDNLSNGSQFNGRDRSGIRGQLYATPSDRLSLRLILDHDEIDEACCGVGNIINGPSGGAVVGLGGRLVPENAFSRSGFVNFNPSNKIKNSGTSLQVDYDLENSLITSITSIRNVTRTEDADVDFTSADIVGKNFSVTDIDTFTQELRWSSVGGEKIDWMVGTFFFDEDVTYDTSLRYGSDARLYVDLLAGEGVPGSLARLETALGGLPPVLFADGAGVVENAGQSNAALSVFGQMDFNLSDRTTLTLGVNFTQDEKDAFVRQPTNSDTFSSLDFLQVGFASLFSALTGGQAPIPANFALFPAQFAQAQGLSTVDCSPLTGPLCNPLLAFQAFQPLLPFVDFPNSVENGNSNDDAVTWTARVAFDINDDLNVYASIGTGFKATSWNLSRDSRIFPADLAAIQAAGLGVSNLGTGTRLAGPEESTVYEIGLKARFEKAALNFAIFDQTIEGFQSNIFTGLGFNLANAGEQSATGFEFDGTYYPTENLQFTLAGTWMDPLYDSFVGAAGVTGPEDLSGTAPAGIHTFSLVASGTYTTELANGWEGFARGEYLFEDKVRTNANVPAFAGFREVSVVNASFGLSHDNGWDIIVWARNLTDDNYLMSSAPAPFQAGSFIGYANPPRTYGITVKKYF
jgi:iron complex outermembrane receptor protein